MKSDFLPLLSSRSLQWKKEITRTFSQSSSDDDDDKDRPYDEGHRWDLKVRLEKDHKPAFGAAFFMETMVRRDETKTKYILYYQTSHQAHPIFCAEKYPPSESGQILLKSIVRPGTKEPQILGSLMKTKESHKTKYELLVHKASQKEVIASIEYQQISMARKFVEGGRPRYAQVKILGKTPCETKEPHCQKGGQRVLNFGGRGMQTSSKNMQLVVTSEDEKATGRKDGCCLQMVKWKENEFNLDFSPPFDAIHAFAFALAQFDF